MIIEYCATRLISEMKIDFHPNKRRLILLSCPLQLISIDSRSPNGLHSLPNFKMVIKMCFNSRSPSRLRLSISAVYIVLLPVSIHAAQAGCDGAAASVASSLIGFQFTQPKRAATWACRLHNIFRGFNSRSPSGLRQEIGVSLIPQYVSIHAAQAGCDLLILRVTRNITVSIHAAQAGCDGFARLVGWHALCFNSRSPSGLRREGTRGDCGLVSVSIHAAQAGCDLEF